MLQPKMMHGSDYMPTFREFINLPRYQQDYQQASKIGQFRIDHWIPISSFCNPCLIDYDFIGRYENFQRDVNLVLKQMHAEHISFPQRKSEYLREPSGSAMVEGFNTISDEELRKLFHTYNADYRLFNYSVPGILKSRINRIDRIHKIVS